MMKLSIAGRRISLLSLTAAAGIWGSSDTYAQTYLVPPGQAQTQPYYPQQVCPPGTLPPGYHPQYPPGYVPQGAYPGAVPPGMYPSRPMSPTPVRPTPAPTQPMTPETAPVPEQGSRPQADQQQTPPMPDRTDSQSNTPQNTQPSQNNQQLNIPPANQNLSTASSSGAQSVAPNMIGDFFGTGHTKTALIQTDTFAAFLEEDLLHKRTILTQRPIYTSHAAYTGVGLAPEEIYVDQFTAPTPGGHATGAFTDRFTTVESNRQVFNRVYTSSTGVETFALRDNPTVQSAVEAFAISRRGPGQVLFLDGDAEFQGFAGQLPNQRFEFDPAWFYGYFTEIVVPGGNVGALPGAQVGRSKLTENGSPIPRDRFFFNYSYFDSVPLTPTGTNVSRLTPGFEKAFWCDKASIELRLPVASTLDSTIVNGGLTETGEQEIGNLTMYLKFLLWQWDHFLISGGTGVTLPTASNVNVIDPLTETTLYRVENSSVHVLPFLGALWTPNARFFAQGFLQFDFDTNGNRVYLSQIDQRGRFTGELRELGRAEDQNYLYFDIGMGYWLYLNRSHRGWITAMAPMVEYHLNTTINNPGDFAGTTGQGMLYNFGSGDDIANSNVVLGLNTMFRKGWSLTAGYAVGGSDKQFDSEFRLVLNKYFGGNSPIAYPGAF